LSGLGWFYFTVSVRPSFFFSLNFILFFLAVIVSFLLLFFVLFAPQRRFGPWFPLHFPWSGCPPFSICSPETHSSVFGAPPHPPKTTSPPQEKYTSSRKRRSSSKEAVFCLFVTGLLGDDSRWPALRGFVCPLFFPFYLSPLETSFLLAPVRHAGTFPLLLRSNRLSSFLAISPPHPLSKEQQPHSFDLPPDQKTSPFWEITPLPLFSFFATRFVSPPLSLRPVVFFFLKSTLGPYRSFALSFVSA